MEFSPARSLRLFFSPWSKISKHASFEAGPATRRMRTCERKEKEREEAADALEHGIGMEPPLPPPPSPRHRRSRRSERRDFSSIKQCSPLSVNDFPSAAEQDEQTR